MSGYTKNPGRRKEGSSCKTGFFRWGCDTTEKQGTDGLFPVSGMDNFLCEQNDRHGVEITPVIVRDSEKIIGADPVIGWCGADNFNAGFCFGTLLGFEIADSALLGMAVSGYYVKNGRSPSAAELREYLSEWKTNGSTEPAESGHGLAPAV